MSILTGSEELNQITQKVIGCLYAVSNTLGGGFLEEVYQNAAIEIAKTGLAVRQQCPICVKYDGVIVGEYFADLLIQDIVLVELKAVRLLDEVHAAQCMNYLRATGLSLGQLLQTQARNSTDHPARLLGIFKNVNLKPSVFIRVYLWLILRFHYLIRLV